MGHTDPIATVPIGSRCEIDTYGGSIKLVENATEVKNDLQQKSLCLNSAEK